MDLGPIVGDAGEAIELVWLTILQNVALCVAAFAKTSKQHWITILLSSFLILFGLASSDRNEVVFLIAVYGIMIAWWLMTRHWQTLERGFVASDSVPFVRLRIIAISTIVLVVAMIGGIVLRNGAIATSLDGFMPTSGGNQGADDAARQGVGNGEMLVAAKDQAFTFGPVDSDLFLESQLPTLYDLASDVFGEAIKKNQLQQQNGCDQRKHPRSFQRSLGVQKERQRILGCSQQDNQVQAGFDGWDQKPRSFVSDWPNSFALEDGSLRPI